jgi:hypothetical protein
VNQVTETAIWSAVFIGIILTITTLVNVFIVG